MLKLMQRGIAACFFAYLLAINQQSSNFTLATLVNIFERLMKGLTRNVHTESAYLTNVYVRECLSLCKEELRHVFFLLICWPLTSKVAISRGQHCEHFERLRKGLTCNVHTESRI